MRENLAKYNGKRLRFEGVVGRFENRFIEERGNLVTNLIAHEIHAVFTKFDQYYNPIKDKVFMADHIWFRNATWAKSLKIGNRFSFTALVYKYDKNEGFNYGLRQVKSAIQI